MARQGSRNQLGQHGENLAAEFLYKKGYVLLATNLHLRMGEIDLLMQDGETIVVVEVKTHSGVSAIDPIYKINPAKQQKLRLLAQAVATRYPERNIRIDAVTLYWLLGGSEPIITHLENIV